MAADQQRTPDSAARLPNVRAGAVVAIALAVAFLVWLLFARGSGDDKAGTSGTTSTTPTVPSIGPVAASQARLHTLAIDSGHPIYWVGPQPDTTYELTRTSSGRVFIRYLPKDVPVGVDEASFTIVGTYPVTNATSVLADLAKKPGEQRLTVPGGGIAVYGTSQPTNVYVAYPGSNLQIEVFDPSAERARRLVTSGQVAPVR